MSSVKTGKGVTMSVPTPERPKFIHGTYPPDPTLPKNIIKPSKAPKRDYGKAVPLSGDTGMTGMT